MIKRKFRFHVTSPYKCLFFYLVCLFAFIKYFWRDSDESWRYACRELCPSYRFSALAKGQHSKEENRDNIYFFKWISKKKNVTLFFNSFLLFRNFHVTLFFFPPTFYTFKAHCNSICPHDCRKKRTLALLRIEYIYEKGTPTQPLHQTFVLLPDLAHFIF